MSFIRFPCTHILKCIHSAVPTYCHERQTQFERNKNMTFRIRQGILIRRYKKIDFTTPDDKLWVQFKKLIFSFESIALFYVYTCHKHYIFCLPTAVSTHCLVYTISLLCTHTQASHTASCTKPYTSPLPVHHTHPEQVLNATKMFLHVLEAKV